MPKRTLLKRTIPCYEKHTALAFIDKETGNPLEIYGGSCITPTTLDADVYLGFDWGMGVAVSRPWVKEVAHIKYLIRDMDVPAYPSEFKELVLWVRSKLLQGLKVHVGCVGGHGRTGTFLVALYTACTGNTDGIDYVRKNYCREAVETVEQEQYLVQHFGCDLPTYNHPGASFLATLNHGKHWNK